MASNKRALSQEQTRARLLDAAEQVFAEEGFAAASLDHIAELAGFTRGAVYANFAGKPELYLAILDRWLTEELAGFERLSAGELTPATLLRELRTIGGTRFADRRHWLLLSEFRLHSLRHPELGERLAAYDRRTRQWYADVIAELAQRAGVTLAHPPEDVALMVLALEYGVASLAHTDDGVDHRVFTAALGELARGLGFSAVAHTDAS